MKTKFKGFSERLNKWVYGYLVEDCMIVNGIIEANRQYISIERWETVVPESVGQFTGKQDVKQNEIYQGDLLSVQITRSANKAVTIVFEEGAFGVKDELFGWGYQKQFYPLKTIMDNHKVEVVGNIYENPELMEDE